jgi:hypothetical protein
MKERIERKRKREKIKYGAKKNERSKDKNSGPM